MQPQPQPQLQSRSFCFVISHYARNTEHQMALRHCIQSIREVHGPDVTIHVIDDHSPVSVSEALKDMHTDARLHVHLNPMPQSGEFGVLYWYLNHADLAPEPFAYCIHDSMVCRKPKGSHSNMHPKSSEWLWYFDRAHGYHHAEIRRHLEIIRSLHGDVEDWWSLFQNQFTKRWVGCFGIACYIARNDLAMLHHTYGLFDSIQYVKTREDRQAMERIFALFYCHAIPPRTICGNIFDHPEMSQPTLGALAYAEKKTCHPEYEKPFLKTWFGR